jgi:predicted 3-demethylubiquinone-9 3-methyltransferase (glyoxalase superfamily)
MPKLTPCIWFDNQGEDAANFYVSVFPNSKIVEVLKHTEAGPGEPGSALLVYFELDGQPYSALNGGPMFQLSEAISFEIDCKDQAEVDYYWNALTADGGEESMCGWLKDKFGVSWQVVPTEFMEMANGPDPVKSNAMIEAMYKMRKLDLATLRAAYENAG